VLANPAQAFAPKMTLEMRWQTHPRAYAQTLVPSAQFICLDRLVNLALPRIRDFQGVSVKSFDGHGNYSLGLEEQLMFPELDYDTIEKSRGMDISIVTSSKTDEEALSLLQFLGMPFRPSSQ
jgi:large subunit ribosomal protein L5